MKFHTAVLALLSVTTTTTSAFQQTHHQRHVVRRPTMVRPSMASTESQVDLTIPYDAAARLAYDTWREKYDKGAFNEGRYEVFKSNYEAITVANVVAKKKAREENGEAPALMTLNEFGDCTEEEYMAAMQGDSSSSTAAPQPTTTGDVLGKAMESAQSQSEASNALKDAADALAEDEEVRVTKNYNICVLCRREFSLHAFFLPFPFGFWTIGSRQKAGSR